MDSTRIVPTSTRPKHAFIVKLNEEAWGWLKTAAEHGVGDLSITLGPDGSLNIPESPFFGLDTSSISPPAELYHAGSSTLALQASAAQRLQIPLTSVPTALQEKLRSSTDAAEQARKDRKLLVIDHEPIKKRKALHGGMEKRMMAARVAPSAAVPASAPISRPSTPTLPSRAGTPVKSGPVVPLKTRVMQLLALGPKSVKDVVARVGGGEDEVSRVLKVVAAPAGSTYSLLPLQYAKIKVAAWPAYTRIEQQQVKKLAAAAFDKMGLPPSADERVAFEAACTAHGSPARSMAAPLSPEAPKQRNSQQDAGPSVPPPPPAKALPKPRAAAGMTRSSSMANIAEKRTSPMRKLPVNSIDVEAANGKRKRSPEDDKKPVGSAIRKLRAEAGPSLKRSSSMPATKVEDREERQASKRPTSPDYTSSGSSDNDRGRKKRKPSAEELRARYDVLLPKHQLVEDEIRRLRRWLERIADGRNKSEGEYVDMARAGEDVRRLVKKRAKLQEELEDIQEWFTE